ncbi:MAG: hypothetical protein KA974_05200 [Saprospiraceae bacterium]|nr:hypothetical protein [Saprospiraceae bacterium]MBP7699303.1 hypothetical protein [Saprospiraceae bacterium]
MFIPFRLRVVYATFFVFLFHNTSIIAQYYEVGWMIGASNYIGDFQINYQEPTEYNLCLGVQTRYNLSPRWAFKAYANKLTISGNDKNNTMTTGLRQRNLNFRTDIFEVGVQTEFNLLPYDVRDTKNSTPYIFLGISGIRFNPQAQRNGVWVDLQPLGTEGQNMSGYAKTKYSKYQLVIPFGVGFKFSLNSRCNLGIEFGFRQTFTDYLDDVSGYYPDIEALRSENPEAADLSYREPEFYKDNSMPNPMGKQRGDNRKYDNYFVGGIHFTINLANKYKMEYNKKYKIFKG